jgi:hypothetical protein
MIDTKPNHPAIPDRCEKIARCVTVADPGMRDADGPTGSMLSTERRNNAPR